MSTQRGPQSGCEQSVVHRNSCEHSVVHRHGRERSMVHKMAVKRSVVHRKTARKPWASGTTVNKPWSTETTSNKPRSTETAASRAWPTETTNVTSGTPPPAQGESPAYLNNRNAGTTGSASHRARHPEEGVTHPLEQATPSGLRHTRRTPRPTPPEASTMTRRPDTVANE